MRIVYNANTRASFNMAAEEYMLKNFTDEVFMLWRADKTVLIGKNQNAYKEVNESIACSHGIKVVRRLSGGGAVYTDLGNVNFAFLTNDKGDGFSNFEKFTKPIIGFLKSLGINAFFSGRNDLLIDGKKFSGNAQYKHKNRLLHHGTLLFCSDMVPLNNVLTPPKTKLKSKGVNSVSSRVTNIQSHLKTSLSVEKFMTGLNAYVKKEIQPCIEYKFSKEDKQKIEDIEKNRFCTWDWTYGVNPQYNISQCKRFSHGTVEVAFSVEKGKIAKIRFFGDFFSKGNVSDVENKLLGVAHNLADIENALASIPLSFYFSGIDQQDILSLFDQ